MLRPLIDVTILIVMTLVLSACPGKLAPSSGYTDSVTMSEIAEAVVSGAVTSSYSTGTQANIKILNPERTFAEKLKSTLAFIPEATAAVAVGQCPQFQYNLAVPTVNTTCGFSTNTQGKQILSLAWGPCSMNAPLATWSGGSNLTLTTSPGSTSMANGCAIYPTFQAGDIVARWFNSPTSRITNLTTVYSNTTGAIVPPVTVLVDTYAATLNYGASPVASTSWPTYASSGYKNKVTTLGETITYTGPVARTILVNGIHLVGSVGNFIVWDFTVSSTNPVTGVAASALNVTAGNVVSGVIYVQDNRNFRSTSATFAGVTYSSGCGIPNAGTVTTTAIDGTYQNETLTASATCGIGTIGGNSVHLYHSF